jgi:hypothetical protein
MRPELEALIKECEVAWPFGGHGQILHRVADELRRLAALEQAAQNNPSPASAWAQGYRDGINDEQESEAGFSAKVKPARVNPYTHPAPRKPMTKEQIDEARKALTVDLEDPPEPWAFWGGVRAAEHFHQIGETPC